MCLRPLRPQWSRLFQQAKGHAPVLKGDDLGTFKFVAHEVALVYQDDQCHGFPIVRMDQHHALALGTVIQPFISPQHLPAEEMPVATTSRRQLAGQVGIIGRETKTGHADK